MPRVLLRDGTERAQTLVCIHGATGLASDYQPLASALAWPGPIAGISAPNRSEFQLRDLADEHVDLLDLSRPQLLLGWSIGGVLAAEMSRIIVARGGTVAFLALIDSRAPQPEMRSRPTDRDTLARFYAHAQALAHEGEPPNRPDPDDLEQRITVFSALVRAFFQHEQHPVPVPIHLFEAADSHPSHPKPPTLGWESLTPSLLRELVPGTHFTVLAPHHAAALAAAIARHLGPLSS